MNEGVVRNGDAVPLAGVPDVSMDELGARVRACVGGGGRVAAFFGYRAPECGGGARPDDDGDVRLIVVLARAGESGFLELLRATVRDRWPSLTPECPEVHLFEREIAESCGIIPEAHPWLKPVRRAASGAAFFRVEGEEVHEVAVGPVHAGVIEPGHFRFQCHGEDVLHLEIALGYQHRGVLRALRGGPDRRTVHYMETLAGDTTIGHSVAYARAIESLAGVRVPLRAEMLRAIALELERLANHTGDLGALAGDVGYLPAMSYCGRLRGEFLNLSARLSGSRLGRGFIRPGGVSFDVDPARAGTIAERLRSGLGELESAVELLWTSPSVMARFEDTGALSGDVVRSLGMVGPAARASGVPRDVRHEFPFGIYRVSQLPLSTWHTGDVAARAHVRWLEIQRSAAFILETIEGLAAGPAMDGAARTLRPDAVTVSLVEGWRGEICHVALTDARGRFAHYQVIDPSFHNWIGLAMAMRGGRISDFPLVNKSFNLSYCGHDL